MRKSTDTWNVSKKTKKRLIDIQLKLSSLKGFRFDQDETASELCDIADKYIGGINNGSRKKKDARA